MDYLGQIGGDEFAARGASAEPGLIPPCAPDLSTAGGARPVQATRLSPVRRLLLEKGGGLADRQPNLLPRRWPGRSADRFERMAAPVVSVRSARAAATKDKTQLRHVVTFQQPNASTI